MAGEAELPGHANLYLGSDPSVWRVGIRRFDRLRAEGIYPGVDLVVHISGEERLEFDLELAPGQDARAVRLRCDSGSRFVARKDGALDLWVEGRRVVTLLRPDVYQPAGGERRAVPGGFRFRGPRTLGFWIGKHDPALPVVIDPQVISSSVFGWNGNNRIQDLKLTGAGHILMLIKTNAPDYPTGGLGQAAGGGYDTVLMSISRAGVIDWCTYYGGSSDEVPNRMALAADGSVYVVGNTASTNLPLLNPVQGAYGGGVQDGFIAHFSSTGTLLASTYLGGSGMEDLTGCGLDASGRLYVCGWSDSKGAHAFPTQNAYQATNAGSMNGVLLCTNPAVSSLLWSTYLGGSLSDSLLALAALPGGGCVFAGTASSANFPAVNPYQSTLKGVRNAVLGMASSAGAVTKCGYFGGSGDDRGLALCQDNGGGFWLGCWAGSTDMPKVNPVQAVHGGGVSDIHLSLWDASLGAPSFATYYGGNDMDVPLAMSTDANGNLWVAGYTQSSNLAMAPDTFQSIYGGGGDGLVLRVVPPAPGSGSYTFDPTYMGNSGNDSLFGIAAGSGVVAVGGSGFIKQINPWPLVQAPPPRGVDPNAQGLPQSSSENIAFALFPMLCPPMECRITISGPGVNQDLSIDSGSAITLTAYSTGVEPLTYSWHLCGGPGMPLGSEQTFSKLRVCPGDDGMQFCVDITDACGIPRTVRCSFTLHVRNAAKVACKDPTLLLMTAGNQTPPLGIDLLSHINLSGMCPPFKLQATIVDLAGTNAGISTVPDGTLTFFPGSKPGAVQITVSPDGTPAGACTMTINQWEPPKVDPDLAPFLLGNAGIQGESKQVAGQWPGFKDVDGTGQLSKESFNRMVSQSNWNLGK